MQVLLFLESASCYPATTNPSLSAIQKCRICVRSNSPKLIKTLDYSHQIRRGQSSDSKEAPCRIKRTETCWVSGTDIFALMCFFAMVPCRLCCFLDTSAIQYRRARIKLDAVKEESAKSEAQLRGSDWWFMFFSSPSTCGVSLSTFRSERNQVLSTELP